MGRPAVTYNAFLDAAHLFVPKAGTKRMGHPATPQDQTLTYSFLLMPDEMTMVTLLCRVTQVCRPGLLQVAPPGLEITGAAGGGLTPVVHWTSV
jgi:hypothetical protein